MGDFQKILTIIASVMTVAGGAAFIWAYYVASLNKAQIEALRGDRDDLLKRVGILEEDKKQLEQTAVKKDQAITETQAKVKVLESIVTHDVTINELIRTVASHDQNVQEHYDDYMKIMSQVLQANERILEHMERRWT